MNSSIRWRIDLTRSLGQRISDINHLHAILIGGSVAKGWADEYSDLEICLCWDKLPSIETRKAIISRLDGKIKNLFSIDANECPLIFEDGFDIGEFHVDMWHCTNAGIESALQEVLVHFNPNLSMQETLYTLQNGIILKDSKQLQEWKARITYPQELRKNYVREHLSVIVKPDLKLHILRDDRMIYYGLFSAIQKRIIHVLFGLNGVFYQGLKNTKSILQNLTIKPVNCWQRFLKVYEVSAVDGAQIMVLLIEEVIGLVEKYLPELDVSDIKERYNSGGRVK